MYWVYLSPHLDDVVLSCGGLIWEQTQQGKQVSIWTLCAGGPPPGNVSAFALSLQQRWNTGQQATSQRRAEDLKANSLLGAQTKHFPLPDCIYRRHPQEGTPLYTSEKALYEAIHPAERPLIDTWGHILRQHLPSKITLVAPLGLGNHVDHQLSRRIAETLGQPDWYYPDYPYILEPEAQTQLEQLRSTGWQSVAFPVSSEGLHAWVQAVAAHRSQISTFWENQEAMAAAIETYRALFQGVKLWNHR